MSLRILFYTDDPGRGGAALCTHHLALNFVRAGFDVVYAQSAADTIQIAERESHGIRHVFLPYDTISEHFRTILDRQTPQSVLVQERPDVVVFSDSVPQSTGGAKIACRALDIPYLVIEHSVLSNNGWARHPHTRSFVREALAGAAQVINVSHANKALLVKLFAPETPNLPVVYNCCGDRFFLDRCARTRARLRAQWRIPEDGIVVLTTAQVIPAKGFHLQFDAIENLKRSGGLDRLHFVWCGGIDGAYGRSLEERAREIGCRDHVRMLGQRDDVGDCLDAADVFLLPSLGEGMPLSVIEAMAKALPVVATDVGGISETLAGCGILVPDPNADADATGARMADALRTLAGDGALRQDLGRRARTRAMAEFKEVMQFERYRALVEEAVFPPDEYVSPGLRRIKADRFFPHVTTFSAEVMTGRPQRSGCTHGYFIDTRFPSIRLPNRDESHLIYNAALGFAGKPALVVGGVLGWAAFHVAAAGAMVDVVDPMFADPAVRSTLSEAFAAARLSHGPFYVGEGAAAVHDYVRVSGRRNALILVDAASAGAECPDVVLTCARSAKADALILLINAGAPAAGPALDGLRREGWRVRLYDTASLVVAAWRGAVVPPDHRPDPVVAWQPHAYGS